MPRTMLRYSIERFSPKRREFYMKKWFLPAVGQKN
jgi:hypothetical protein